MRGAARDRLQTSGELATAAAVGAGALLAVQARVNGGLARRLDSPVLAALVSFAVGTVGLVVVATLTRQWRRARRPVERLPLWWFCGGLAGAFLVSVSAQAVPVIGVALLTVCIVAGQTLGGLAVDRLGLSPLGQQPLNAARVVGAASAVAALGIAAVGQSGTVRPALFLLIALAGLGVAAQQAANGHLQRVSGQAVLAALVSFTVGTLALGAGVAVLSAAGRLSVPDWPAPSALYLGGLCGAAYITLAATVVRWLGVLRLTLASVAGQLVGGIALDLLAPAARGPRPATVVAAVLLMGSLLLAGRGSVAAQPLPAH